MLDRLNHQYDACQKPAHLAYQYSGYILPPWMRMTLLSLQR